MFGLKRNGSKGLANAVTRDIIGYCTCMGIYCVERVLLADLPELARATTPKELVQHNIFPYKCNNLFIT